MERKATRKPARIESPAQKSKAPQQRETPDSTQVVFRRAQAQEKLAYKPREVARILSLAEGTIYKLLAEGVIPSITIGHRIIVPAEGLRKFLSEGAAR
jgi:excisionase family DNA binding protein